MRLKVYDNKIVFYFGIFDKIIYFSDIECVEIKDYDFWKYWGWGIRWNPFDNSRAWVTRSGKGVLIKTKTKEYFLSTNDPIRLNEAILRYLPSKKA